jgi:GGDEF domain-containing protein
MERSRDTLYDPVVVVDEEGAFVGTVTMKQIVTRAGVLEVEMAKNSNPLSGLPGNRQIERWIKTIQEDEPLFSVVYADLDRFKEFNDRYGFLRGDQLIRLTAEILQRGLSLLPPRSRLGHVGGDDFVFVVPGEVPCETLETLCAAFDEEKRGLFSTEDFCRGCYEAETRTGEHCTVPLVTLSLAVVESRRLPGEDASGLLVEVAASLKKKVKPITSRKGAVSISSTVATTENDEKGRMRENARGLSPGVSRMRRSGRSSRSGGCADFFRVASALQLCYTFQEAKFSRTFFIEGRLFHGKTRCHRCPSERAASSSLESRAFEPRPVEKEVLRRIFEAARWAASAYNEQPWRFLLASRDQEPAFSLLLGCLVEQNQVWAANAGALAVGVTRKFFTHNEKPNRHAHHDLGLAVAQLTLQAVAEGIFVHPMAGFSLERVRQVWSVPRSTNRWVPWLWDIRAIRILWARISGRENMLLGSADPWRTCFQRSLERSVLEMSMP